MQRSIQLAVAFLFMLAAGPAAAAPLGPLPQLAGVGTPALRVQGLQLQLGIPDGRILSALSRNGYTDIKITRKQLTKARAEACKDGKRWDVEVAFDGRIRRANPIGDCRAVITAKVARQILRRQGFSAIQMASDGQGFVATACRGNRRFRVAMNPFGDIHHETLLGRCGGVLTQYDIAALLHAQGYSRIDAKRVRRGQFSAEACRGDDRVALRIGHDGAILKERRIGRCDPPIHPATIPAVLARYGFTRIEIVDRRLPRYVAHACRDTERLQISLNRFGEIVGERSIGRCQPRLSVAAMETRLRDIGYHPVRIVEHSDAGFVAEVCEDGTRLRLELTRYGETLSEQRLGECRSRRVRKILRELEKDGVRGATAFVEGCRKGKRVRIQLDPQGSFVERTVIGRCR